MRMRYQPADNSLRLTLNQEPATPGERTELAGYVDVGEGGRLVGVEPLAGDDIALSAAFSPWLADPVAREYISLDNGGAYIELSAPEEADLRENLRTVETTLVAEFDPGGCLLALSIPRRGAGYEISYPSGNQ